MLDTLLKIGRWQREKLSKWDRILDKPNVRSESRGKPVTNYVVGLVFDLDKQDVYVDSDLLKEYDDDRDPEYFKAIQILGGNNKSIYATVEPDKLKQIFKTYFGKLKNEDAEYGEFIEAVDKAFPEFQDTELYKLVKALFPLRNTFVEKATKDGKTKFKNILDSLDLGTYEKVALVYAAVKAKEFGFNEPYPIARLDGYEQFLDKKFLESEIEKSDEKLCYASANVTDDVNELNLKDKYSLNKMFVTTTQNYLTEFNKKQNGSNYQVSVENQEYLDLASQYLLENYKTRIADVDHVIIPQFIHQEELDLDMMLDRLKAKTDLLFSLQALDDTAKNIELETDTVYWLNFMAFESDGNFFKTMEVIKDVSKFHFQDVLKAFEEVHWEFGRLKNVVDWSSVMKTYGDDSRFNLYTVYRVIPVRKDKEKKNVALQLFKTILEQRKVEKDLLFDLFTELILCHYYGRYSGYTNIQDYSQNGNRNRQQYFTWAIRDSVFKYLAFIQVLKQLNLIDMEQDHQTVPAEEVINDFDQKIEHFFKRMDFNDQQKAMFFLGRMLSAVAYLQQGKNKTVIDKVNYNGMDRDDIVRLRVDLFEKAKQYGKPKKVVFSDSHFGQHFDFEHWVMNPQEAVFFILTGYSFGIVKQADTNSKND